jgi:signal transduction histidine kinase
MHVRATPKHCLLVVDDEADLVHSVQDLLRRDYRVLGATRAAEGLRLLEHEPVHVVMTDQRMPEMTGVEFLKQLRTRYPGTVRLLFTAYADIKAVTEAINEGNVYRYITKPWENEELQVVLRQAAEYYDLTAERERLLAELQEKNRQLQAANAELRQANDLKKAFIRVASHELRTPLTTILGLSDLARRTQNVAHPLSHWLDRIHAGGQRLNVMVDQMLKLLLAERFDRPLALEAVDLAELLRRAAEDVATFAEWRHLTLDIDLPADLGSITVEPDKIRDSVAHLLLNAIKFTPDGGMIRLAARRLSDGGAEICVSDTGVGIDPASCARLFDPFFTRFDVSRHSSGVFEFERRGLGLGLSLVKAFVEGRGGGRVAVHSDVGKGSTFTVTLPPQPPGAGRAGSLEIKDEGKFFSAEAIKQANEIIREIYGKYDHDLLTETYATVPGDEAEREKVKRMNGKEKSEYFRKWAAKRAEAAVVNGVYILICRDPTYFKINVTRKGRSAFESKAFAKLQETILSELRDKRFDEGLLQGVKFVRDRFAAAK